MKLQHNEANINYNSPLKAGYRETFITIDEDSEISKWSLLNWMFELI